MTRRERIDAFRLRLDGSTWEAIGAILGYTARTVRDDIYNCIARRPRQPNIKFSGLRQYVVSECGGSVRKLAREAGVDENLLYRTLPTGQIPPETAAELVRATGRTYQELFGPEERREP